MTPTQETTPTPATPPPAAAKTDMEVARELFDRAVTLAPDARWKLAEELRYSLEPEEEPVPAPTGGPNDDKDWEWWKAEIVRRIEAHDRGEAKSYSIEEAMALIRADREGRPS